MEGSSPILSIPACLVDCGFTVIVRLNAVIHAIKFLITCVLPQDDSYIDSYISTIGVDFVSINSQRLRTELETDFETVYADDSFLFLCRK